MVVAPPLMVIVLCELALLRELAQLRPWPWPVFSFSVLPGGFSIYIADKEVINRLIALLLCYPLLSYPPCANDNSQIKMTLPRSSINGIKSNLDRAVSAKDPAAIATAVDVPLLTSNDVGGIIGTSNNNINPSSGSVHREQLKIDNVDWSNVLNFLLDVHLAIMSVRFTPTHNNNKLYIECTWKYLWTL